MQKELIESYNFKKNKIKSKLDEFKKLNEKDYFKEFIFCLLTPQSNAQRCWEAVEQLQKIEDKTLENITEILKRKTRFHNTKAKRILSSKESWEKVLPLLENDDKIFLRNEIAKIVNGYGLKEASHFLRNIGHSNNQLAILDRHILRNLKSHGIIPEDKIKNQKNYLEIEKKFIQFANSLNIPADELDILFWSQENGEIFK